MLCFEIFVRPRKNGLTSSSACVRGKTKQRTIAKEGIGRDLSGSLMATGFGTQMTSSHAQQSTDRIEKKMCFPHIFSYCGQKRIFFFCLHFSHTHMLTR